MAVVIDAAALVTLEDCESAESGWTPSGNWTQYSGFNRQGANCFGCGVSNTTYSCYKTVSPFDMSAAAIYVWVFAAGNMDTLANGGIGIVLGDGTNRRAYYVGGGDQSKFQIGAWSCFMVDGANPPASYNQELGSAAPNFAAITQAGVRFKTLSKSLGGADNCFIDYMHWGTGIRIEGGTTGDRGTFAEIAAADKAKTGAWGIVREVQPGLFEVQGALTFGDNGTADSYFEDEDAIVMFADNGASDGLYDFILSGNSTGTNLFKLGEIVGSGDIAKGRNGCTIVSSGPSVAVDLNDANMDEVDIYGGVFRGLGLIELSAATGDDFIGNVVDNCGQVTANQCRIRACSFNGYTPDGDAALLWNDTINIKNCTFVNNADPTNDPHAIEHPDQGSYNYYGMRFSGNDYDIYYTAPASSGVLTINADAESDPGTYEILNPTGNSVSIVNTVTLTIRCRDKNNDPVGNVSCAVYKLSDDTELMNEDSNAVTGDADQSYNYLGDIDIYWRVRESPVAGNRYRPKSGLGGIKSTGLDVTVLMEPEPLA